MSRILSWSICLVVAGGLVFLSGGCEKGTAPDSDRSRSAQPELCLKEHLGLVVPKDARNVRCHVEAMMVMWVFARLDVLPRDLPGLLSSHPLDRLPPLSQNADLVKQLQVNAAEIPWWQVSAGESLTVSRSTWRKSGGSSDWECALSICVERKADVATVYLQYYEEPVSHGATTGDAFAAQLVGRATRCTRDGGARLCRVQGLATGRPGPRAELARPSRLHPLFRRRRKRKAVTAAPARAVGRAIPVRR